MRTRTDNVFIYYKAYTAGVYAIACFAFTLCTVVEAVDSVKCRLDTDSAVLRRRLLGAPCDDAICLRLLHD